ncbi:MAG TPA: hypothetical protein DCG38_06155 [Eubacteriaceae bacterium]|jgi:DNA repair ATPase RecN|nr:hypothetical protein [Eubacteriaceae bacterium]
MNSAECQELLSMKLEFLNTIFENSRIEKSSLETCLKILENNKAFVAKIMDIDARLDNCDTIELKEHEELKEEILLILEDIKQQQKILLEKLDLEKVELGKVLEQFSKKRQVANNYIKGSNGPVFVDKDFK